MLAAAGVAQAAAGGGSSGFGGGGGEGGHGKGFFIYVLLRLVFYLLVHHPLVLAGIVLVGVAAWVSRALAAARAKAGRARRVRRVELAAAEASEDDGAFAPEAVRARAASLFGSIQSAWDARDRARLAELVGPDLLVEWRRRLDDFASRGWHNRVSVLRGPTIEYVSLANRAQDRDDRVVVRVEATLSDAVEDGAGRRLKRNDRLSQANHLAEYWTLAKRDDRWILVSIEQDAEGAHHLKEDLVATPWSETGRLRDQALVEGAVVDKLPGDVKPAEIADLDFAGDARAQALDLSLADGRFGPDVIEVAVRRAVAAWAEAVDGDDADLRRLAAPAALRELIHPGDASEKTRVVVRGPRVRRVDIVELDAATEPPRLVVEVQAEGRRYIEDRDSAAVLSGSRSSVTRFTERWALALDGPDEQPWRIVDARPVVAHAAEGAAPAHLGEHR